MDCCRFEDPPEEIEKEASHLFRKYLNQFSDGDELSEDFSEDGFDEYMLAHGSDKLKRYYRRIQKLRAEAERDGVMIG